MPDPVAGREIHGTVTENPLLLALLKFGNLMRYGRTEGERQDEVQALRAPGVEDVAYQDTPSVTRSASGAFTPSTAKTFDPAATERYTSAYDLGQMFMVPPEVQPLLHSISSGGRAAMYSNPSLRQMFSVGEERPALRQAEELGMARGSKNQKGRENLVRALMLMGQQ